MLVKLYCIFLSRSILLGRSISKYFWQSLVNDAFGGVTYLAPFVCYQDTHKFMVHRLQFM